MDNGSTIRMGSVNQVDSCVGRSYDLIIFDEAALADGEDAFNVALRPTLDKDNSKAIFISTPRGKNNWFAKFFQRGFTDEFPSWASIRATYKDNPRMSPADIEEARKSTSDAEFRQEYEADFNTYEGQVWRFNAEECVANLEELDTSKMDVFAGLDVGYRDPTALCVIGYDWDEQKYYVLDEYFNSERTTEQHAMEIQKLINKWDIDYIFIDSAAQQTRFDFAQQYDIPTNNAKKSVLDGIAHVEKIVDNNELIVDQGCKEVLGALDQYQWDPNPNLLREKPKHNMASHMADALRYALYSFETSSSGF
jgi:phage terminase large subunit